jgi:uncharacterized membrane protein
MEVLGAYHPAIVHAPIALIVTSLLFDLVGRATDLDWWRRAAAAMLVIGVLGAGVAVFSGKQAEETADHRQGVPEAPIESHERAAYITLALGMAAVVARATASRLGSMRPMVAALAFLLHVAAAVMVGITGYRGGELVFEHAAGVKLHGELIKSGPPGKPEVEEMAKVGAPSPP